MRCTRHFIKTKMAHVLIFLCFSLVFVFGVISSDKQEQQSDFKVNVTLLGKEDVNTSIYQKYLAHLKNKYNRTVNENGTIDLISPNSTESAAVNESSKRPKWFCQGREMEQDDSRRVLLVNDSTLLKWINSSNNASDGCAVVMFFAPFCRFSASIAPQFNAFGRAYNNTPVLAIDAYKYSSLNARFGVVAIPTILIFHAGKPVLKFNHSKTLDDLRTFVKNYTGLEGNMSVLVTDKDFDGPISSVATKETDIYLILSTLFVFSFGLYIFIHSHYGSLLQARLLTMDWSGFLRWCKIKSE